MATGVEELLDMLFEMIDEAKSMPLSSDKCILERDKALDLLDEIRAQFPMELAEAKKLIAARTEYIASAKREGELIRKQAHRGGGGRGLRRDQEVPGQIPGPGRRRGPDRPPALRCGGRGINSRSDTEGGPAVRPLFLCPTATYGRLWPPNRKVWRLFDTICNPPDRTHVFCSGNGRIYRKLRHFSPPKTGKNYCNSVTKHLY